MNKHLLPSSLLLCFSLSAMEGGNSIELLERPSSINSPKVTEEISEEGTLYAAAESGDIEEFERLLQKEDVDIYTQHGPYTILHIATKKGHSTIVGLLLEKEKQIREEKTNRPLLGYGKKLVERVSETEYTALDLAARYGHSSCVGTLIDYGAPVDKKTHYYNKHYKKVTPLVIATCHNNSECTQLLIGNKEEMTGDIATALCIGATRNSPEALEVIIQKLGKNKVNSYFYSKTSPLCFACNEGSEKAVRKLLKLGMYGHWKHVQREVEKHNRYLLTPLGYAANNNRRAVCEILLQECLFQAISKNITLLAIFGIPLSLEVETFLAVLYKHNVLEKEAFIACILKSTLDDIKQYCGITYWPSTKKMVYELAAANEKDLEENQIPLSKLLNPETIKDHLPTLLDHWLTEQQAAQVDMQE